MNCTPDVFTLIVPDGPEVVELTAIVQPVAVESATTLKVPAGPFAVVALAEPVTAATPLHPLEGVAENTVDAFAVGWLTVTVIGTPSCEKFNVRLGCAEPPVVFRSTLVLVV